MMLIRLESGRTGRVKMSSINFEHISNYNHYFVSVGRKMGRIMFEMQMVFFFVQIDTEQIEVIGI